MTSIEGSFEMQPVFTQKLSPDTAVYDQLEGSGPFFRKIINKSMTIPDSPMNVSFVGASGAGKETNAGQFLVKLNKDKKLQEFLAETGRTLDVRYVSTGHVLAYAQEKGWLTSEWGQFSPFEFAGASILMRDIVHILNTEPVPEDVLRFNVVEAVAVARPLNLGTFALQYLAPLENHYSHMIVRNTEVQDEASKFRGSLWEKGISASDLKAVAEDTHVEWDMDISDGDIDEIRKSMGNNIARERIDRTLNDAIFKAKNDQELYGFDYEFSREEIDTNDQLRVLAEKAFFEGIARKIWKVKRGHALVSENEYLNYQDVRFFRGVIQSHTVNVPELFAKALAFYRAPEGSNY